MKTNTKMLQKLPKDILIKLIGYIEDDYKKKYFETKMLLDMMNTCCDYRVKKHYCSVESCPEFCYTHDTNIEGDSDDNGPDQVILVASSSPLDFIGIDHILIKPPFQDSDILDENVCNKYGTFCYYSCERWYCKSHWKDNSIAEQDVLSSGKLEIYYLCKNCSGEEKSDHDDNDA